MKKIEENQEIPQKETIAQSLTKYKSKNVSTNENPVVNTLNTPKPTSFNAQEFEKTMSKETDPDLMMSYEIIKLPSQGLFYSNGLSEVNVEYMTSKDEDLITTPSLIDAGIVLDLLLKRKIKTHGVVPDDLLTGDRNAILLFLRISSYGSDYTVNVSDPRTNIPFQTTVDLNKLRYKEIVELPDSRGYFNVDLPMRKKTVTFRLLTSGEENQIFKRAEAIKDAYNENFSQYNTLKLKASVVAINDINDRSYIDKFIDVMPALDALTIRKKIMDVSPDVDMSYDFKAKDEYVFKANLTVGIDFFFPGI
jgi:hypothetical protein